MNEANDAVASHPGSAFQVINLCDAELLYRAHFIEARLGHTLFHTLKDSLPFAQPRARLFGRMQLLPRLQTWHGDPGAVLTYSGMRLEPKPWTRELAMLRDRIGTALDARFNSVLVNLYRDGRDSVSWHSDDEPELGEQPLIASLSLGEPRRFRMHHCLRKDLPGFPIDLEHGSLLVMRGTTQKFWEHAVPKTARRVGPRINLTFRVVEPSGCYSGGRV